MQIGVVDAVPVDLRGLAGAGIGDAGDDAIVARGKLVRGGPFIDLRRRAVEIGEGLDHQRLLAAAVGIVAGIDEDPLGVFPLGVVAGEAQRGRAALHHALVHGGHIGNQIALGHELLRGCGVLGTGLGDIILQIGLHAGRQIVRRGKILRAQLHRVGRGRDGQAGCQHRQSQKKRQGCTKFFHRYPLSKKRLKL